MDVCKNDKPKRWWGFGGLDNIFKIKKRTLNPPEGIDESLDQTC